MNKCGVACALRIHDLSWTLTKFRGLSRSGHDFHPAMNIMMSTRHRATMCRVERSERHWDQITAFAVRQVAMRQMQRASRNAAATLPTPESTDDAFSEVTEELTALRA